MRFLWLMMLYAVIFASFVSAATIQGDVYDLSLKKVNDIIVSVNSTPKQNMVVKDGSYSFTLSEGSYLLEAEGEKGKASEIVEIDEEGEFTLDLILFPEDEEIKDIGISVEGFEKGINVWLIVIIIVLVSLITAGILYWKFKPKEAKKEEKEETKEEQKIEEESDLNQVVKFIKEQGGRTTQKDIRKKFGLSEAKISLMVTELEHNKKVKRIKKGRGNVIILEK
ncbi:hypothetical protein J4414_02365 [Candidatus Woesearchaeota archaeon]|nr:hypothetical protein [Candidatus Woesearchaeota archaeon]